MSDSNSREGEDELREPDHALELARAVSTPDINEPLAGKEITSGESLDGQKGPSISPGTASSNASARPRNNRADNGAPAAWKRSLPKSLVPSTLQLTPDRNERKGPEGVTRTESLIQSQDSGDNVDVSPIGSHNGSREADPGMLEYIAQASNSAKDRPLSSVRPTSKRTPSNNISSQLAPVLAPATNVDPLAAKTILGSIRRGINPGKETNIVSTLNIIDNQMAMAGIGIHSRASLFVSLLDESSQQNILNKADLANNWEALRAYLMENRANKTIRSDVMEDFMRCARSVSIGSAESCARLAVEQLELMLPATTAKLGVPTFIAAIPDESLRTDFHELYEMTHSAMDAESDDENACTVAFIEAAKLVDRRKNGRLAKGKKPHHREQSVGSVTSEKSRQSAARRSSRGNLSHRGSASFQSNGTRTPRVKRQTTRIYDRLTGEEHVVEREAPPHRDGYGDDNESIVSGRSRYSRGASMMGDTDSKKSKSIVSVYNYPKDLPLAQLVELTTPPAGRAPVMIRHKDGLVKILFSNYHAAHEVTNLLNNCTVNNVVLGATCELRGTAHPPPGDEILKQQSSVSPSRAMHHSQSLKPMPSFAGRSPTAAERGHGPPMPVEQPVFPEKEDISQLWDAETDLFVGTLALVLAAVCSGFGNSFEAISPLAYLHIFFLLLGFEFFNRGMGHAWHGFVLSIGIVVVSQSLGTMLGFSYFFSYPSRTAVTVNVTLLFSVILWLAYAIIGVMLEYAYRYKFPDSTSVPFVFPAAHTMISTVMFGSRFGTFFAQGNAVIDYAPMRQIAAAFGIGGIHFLSVLLPTLLFLKVIRHRFKPPAVRTVGYYCLAILILICTMAFVEQSDYMYQRSVHRGGYHPTVPVSCVTGRDYEFESTQWNQVMASTRNRLQAGDAIVMWADRTVSVSTDLNEAALITEAQDMVRDFSTSNTTYLGISYQRIISSRKVRDMFYLIGPGGTVDIKHQKVYPIPFLDDNVIESGDKGFEWHETSALGKLGVGMGFEVSNPSYTRQAGNDRVDILLQPLWSHGGLGRRRFDTDAVRAIENGFTLFRCDSNGVSGIVNPRGEVLDKEYVSIDPENPNLFSLPLRKRVATFYNAAGFSFDYICTAFTCLFWLLTLTPWYFLDAISNFFKKKEEKEHNFVITRGGSDDYDLTHNQPQTSRDSIDDGNPFADVTHTALNVTPDSEEEDHPDEARYSSYYNHVDYGGDEV